MTSQRDQEPRITSRGAVLVPEDLTWETWPARAKEAGLNLLALHPTPTVAGAFVQSESGQAFLAHCQGLGLDVEYELHAMSDLLPRELYAQHPDLFRMDEEGRRRGDWNLCVSSPAALDLVAENAVKLAEVLRPTTGRYHLWGDDGRPWCRCPRCRELSDSEQALTLENHLLQALQRIDPECQVAHLAYLNTLEVPRQVWPLRSFCRVCAYRATLRHAAGRARGAVSLRRSHAWRASRCTGRQPELVREPRSGGIRILAGCLALFRLEAPGGTNPLAL